MGPPEFVVYCERCMDQDLPESEAGGGDRKKGREEGGRRKVSSFCLGLLRLPSRFQKHSATGPGRGKLPASRRVKKDRACDERSKGGKGEGRSPTQGGKTSSPFCLSFSWNFAMSLFHSSSFYPTRHMSSAQVCGRAEEVGADLGEEVRAERSSEEKW